MLWGFVCLAVAFDFNGRNLQQENPTEFYNHLVQSFWPGVSTFIEKTINDVLTKVNPVPGVGLDISLQSNAPEINNLRAFNYTEHNRCGQSMYMSFDSSFNVRGNARPIGIPIGFEINMPRLHFIVKVDNFQATIPLFYSFSLAFHDMPEIAFRFDDGLINLAAGIINVAGKVKDAFTGVILSMMVQKSLEFRVPVKNNKNIALFIVEPILALIRGIVTRPSVHRRPLAVLRLQNNPELSTIIAGRSEKIPAGGGNAVILAEFDEEISQKVLTIQIASDKGQISLDSFRNQATHSVQVGSSSVPITGCIGRVVQDVQLMGKSKSGYFRLQVGDFDVGTLTDDDAVDVKFTDGTTSVTENLASIWKRKNIKPGGQPGTPPTRLEISESFLWPVKNVDTVSLTITVTRAGKVLKTMMFSSQTLISTVLSAQDDGAIVDLYVTEDSCGKPRSIYDVVPVSSTCQIGPKTHPVPISTSVFGIIVGFLVLMCLLLCCAGCCVAMYRSQKRTLQDLVYAAPTALPKPQIPQNSNLPVGQNLKEEEEAPLRQHKRTGKRKRTKLRSSVADQLSALLEERKSVDTSRRNSSGGTSRRNSSGGTSRRSSNKTRRKSRVNDELTSSLSFGTKRKKRKSKTKTALLQDQKSQQFLSTRLVFNTRRFQQG